jgi:hypothetical protein
MSGPAGFDIYSNCMDISAFMVTTERDVVVPGVYDVMSEVYRCSCCRTDCTRIIASDAYALLPTSGLLSKKCYPALT